LECANILLVTRPVRWVFPSRKLRPKEKGDQVKAQYTLHTYKYKIKL